MQCSGLVSVFAIVSVVWNTVVFSQGVQNCFAVNFAQWIVHVLIQFLGLNVLGPTY